jgi:predicted HicB family RNase H-like nuclease
MLKDCITGDYFMLEYKSYSASVEVNHKNHTLRSSIKLGKKVIAFESDTVSNHVKKFEKLIDDYLNTEYGQEEIQNKKEKYSREITTFMTQWLNTLDHTDQISSIATGMNKIPLLQIDNYYALLNNHKINDWLNETFEILWTEFFYKYYPRSLVDPAIEKLKRSKHWKLFFKKESLISVLINTSKLILEETYTEYNKANNKKKSEVGVVIYSPDLKIDFWYD